MSLAAGRSVLPSAFVRGRAPAAAPARCCCCMTAQRGVEIAAAGSRLRSRGRSSRKIVCEVALKVEGAAQGTEVGSRIRVKGPLTVFHVPKRPEFDIGGMEGEVKEVLFSWKGKTISANLPFKVQFFLPADAEGGKPIKFVAHLREDEFEVIS